MVRLYILVLAVLSAFLGSAQFNYNCGNYSTIGDTLTDIPGNNCDSNISGIVTTDTLPWTGVSCTGTLVTTMNSGPVSCATIIYTSINYNDYGIISTDTGGSLTLSAINANVSDSVVGPYNCSPGNFGSVALMVCSTIPFNTVTLTNSGCASGWVGNCGTADFTSIELESLMSQVQVVPNPSSESFRLISGISLEGSDVSIYDLSGKLVMVYHVTEDEPIINVSNLIKGCYIMQLATPNITIVEKLVIE